MTMVPGAGVLDDAAVIVRGRDILGVGPRRTVLHGFVGPRVDHGDATLVPGLVNAHCHLELSHLRGAIPPGLGFAGWVRRLTSLPMAGFDDAAARAAAREMAETGTVFVADIATRHPGKAARALAAGGLAGTVFFEAFGYAPPAGQEPDWPGDMPPPQGASGTPETPEAPDISLAGHALYSTHPDRLRAAKAWTTRQGLPFSLHLAEHEGETALLADGSGEFAQLLRARVLPADYVPPGRSPVAQADALGLLDAHTLAVHVVHVDAADIRVLAERGCTVCLCPRSNAHIGVGTAPLNALAAAGIPLCLGTDSLASNTDLDLWNEVRYLLKHSDRFSLAAALLAVTTTPSRLLGRETSMGMLAPGMRSGLTLLPGDLENA
jgi:cytosine/adenosine deaminase-related metal-dependent hydrolase